MWKEDLHDFHFTVLFFLFNSSFYTYLTLNNSQQFSKTGHLIKNKKIKNEIELGIL